MDIIEETNSASDTTYILNCDVPQENILKSSDPYLNTLIGTSHTFINLKFIKILNSSDLPYMNNIIDIVFFFKDGILRVLHVKKVQLYSNHPFNQKHDRLTMVGVNILFIMYVIKVNQIWNRRIIKVKKYIKKCCV